MSGEIKFADRCYGKNYVRLLHVTREGLRHDVKEIEVDTALTLLGVDDYTKGDNKQVIATDSQKNTVYALARKHGVASIESFALTLATHFLRTYAHVNCARIRIRQQPWKRIRDENAKVRFQKKLSMKYID